METITKVIIISALLSTLMYTLFILCVSALGKIKQWIRGNL
jgi:hypothetical protein